LFTPNSIASRTKKTLVEGIDSSPFKTNATVTHQSPIKARRSPLFLSKSREHRQLPNDTGKRSLIEDDGVREMIKRGLVCISCTKVTKLTVQFPSVGVTTIPELHCHNCGMHESAAVSLTGKPKKNAHKALTDYDTNFKYVLGFLSSGDGPTEADRLLCFLSLPNGSTMKTNTFNHMINESESVIVGIAKEVLWKNLVEEIRLTMLLYPDFNIEEWKKASLLGQAQLTQAYVDSTMDMGWNKRSSGLRFDSLSGHAFLYGVLTRLPIAMCSKSKYCSICSWWQKNKDGMEAWNTAVR
jgi:hypothetical protein